MEYKVVYRTEVSANSPKEAALEVEKVIRDPVERPHFEITDEQGVMTNIDLDQEPVKE